MYVAHRSQRQGQSLCNSFFLLLLLAAPALVVLLPQDIGTLVLCLVLPAAGITLGLITNNVGKDRKYNRNL